MAAVWFLGRARVQRVVPADWVAAGTTGPAVTWRPENGWSVPRASLTAAQLAVLNADGQYNTNAPDGPRPDSAVLVPSADALVSEAELDQLMADRTANTSSLMRQLLNSLGLGTVPDGSVTAGKIGSGAVTAGNLGAGGVTAAKLGTDVPAALAAAPEFKAAFGTQAWGRTFVLLGNSRIFLETNSDRRLRQQRGAFTWANQMLRQRCRVLNYAGVSGDRLAQMIARYPTDVAAFSPRVVLIADAINDISDGRSVTEIQGWYNQLIDLNRSIGARTVLLTTNPRDALGTAGRAVLGDVNRWLKSLTDPDVLTIDVTSAVAADTGSAWATGLATDGLHQSRRGAARIGRAVAAALDPVIPRVDVLPSVALDPGNGISNPFMAGTPGTAVPSGYTVFPAQGSGVAYTLVARTDQRPGNWLQIDTASASADAFVAFTAPLTGVAAAGDAVEAVVEVDADTWTSVAGQIRLHVRLLDASNAAVATATDGENITGGQVGDSGDSSAYPLENQPGSGSGAVVFRTPRLVVPSTATQIKFEFEFNGQGKVRLGRAATRKALNG